MLSKLYDKTGNNRFSEIPRNFTNEKKNEVICDILEEGLPDILEIAYAILIENKMNLVLQTLQAYTRIFSYTHGKYHGSAKTDITNIFSIKSQTQRYDLKL